MQDADNSFVFFKPSPKLADEILKQNQALVKEYAARTAPEEVEEGDDEPDIGRFGFSYKRPVRQTLTSPVEMGQQLITEKIYNYLSSLSESSWAMEGGSFPVSEYLPRGMITMLGFSSLRKQPDSQRAVGVWQLVERLTEEFVDWLANEQNGAFVTPWLEIHLTTDGELRLIAIPESEVEDGTIQEIDEAAMFQEIDEAAMSATEGTAHVYGAHQPSEGSSTSLARILEMKEEIDAAVSAFQARTRAYLEARKRKESAVETSASGDDYGLSESRQDNTFATASGHAEENAG